MPVTGLDVLENAITPPFTPTNPPTTLLGPVLVTGPDAVDAETEPTPLARLNAPMNPPRMLLPPPITAPVAEACVMTPSLAPAKPPAKLPAPTLTLPLACASTMSAVLKYGAPSALPQPGHMKLFEAEFDATNPPAMLPLPACTLLVLPVLDDTIVPELLPTNPPACRFATLALPTFPLADELEIRP